MFKKIFAVLLAAPLFVSAESAVTKSLEFDSVCKGKIVNIDSIPGGAVLYKSDNIHGGRGATFLVQNVSQRTGKEVLEVRNARCETIGALGLYATDFPYGARYYARTGGSGQSGADFLAQAVLVGSTNILIEGIGGTWIMVHNPTERDGSINK